MTYDGRTYTQPLGSNSYFGDIYNSPFTDNSGLRSVYGWVFYANLMSGRGAYDPSGGVYYLRAGGFRHKDNLESEAVGRVSYYWTNMPSSTTAAGNRDKGLYSDASHRQWHYSNDGNAAERHRTIQSLRLWHKVHPG